MKLKMFAIHDSVAQQYAPPFVMPNQGTAVRAFVGLCTDQDSRISANPSDFDLYELGTFDDETCIVELEPLPVLVQAGRFALKPKE